MAKKKSPSTKAGKSSGQKSKKSTKTKATGNRSTSNQARFIVSPYTHEKVYIAQATLKDLQSPSTYRNDGKRLWTISSHQIRHEHYQQVCQVLSRIEQDLLPPSGMRSWTVETTMTEHNGNRVLFRPYRGTMELAVLPHLIDRIPNPPLWPGRRHQKQHSEEYRAMEGEVEDDDDDAGKRRRATTPAASLADREMSALSCLAWDELRGSPHYYAVPTIATKWKSPDGHKAFSSRTAAWDHAKVLCQKEVLINRNLEGIGPSGKKLAPFVPTLPTALKVGALRFERDGLWVIGQELAWQTGRDEELLEEKAQTKAAAEQKVYKSGLQLYIASTRHAYRDDPQNECNNLSEADKKLRLEWRRLTPQQQQEWNDKVQAQFEGSRDEESVDKDGCDDVDSEDDGNDKDSLEYVRPITVYIQTRRQNYRYEEQMKLDMTGKNHFTLAQADRELKTIWKNMTKEEKESWTAQQEVEEAMKEAGLSEEGKVESEGMKVDSNGAPSVVASFSDIPPEDEKSEEAGGNEEAGGCHAEAKPAAPKAANVLPSCQMAASVSNTDVEEEKKEDHVEHPPVPPSEAVQVAASDRLAKPCAQGQLSSEAATSDATRPVITPTLSMSESSSAKEPPCDKPRRIYNNGRIKFPTAKATQRWCLDQEKIDLCKEACMEHYESVMRTVKARDLLHELQDGFDVLRERGRGRFDMTLPAFDEPQFSFLTDFKETPWMPVVRAILGEDVVLIHKGCFLSLPGAESQVYHQDGLHLTSQTQRPCHAINVFVPLVDLHTRSGPTEFVLGSHILGQEGFDKDFTETPKPKAGTPVIFDYRLGHRGMANSSNACRPILYCTYARAADGKEFRDSVNFSKNAATGKRYHKIGDLSAKPLSREERRNKRKRSIESKEEEEMNMALEASFASTTPPDAAARENASLPEEAISEAAADTLEHNCGKKASLPNNSTPVPVDNTKLEEFSTRADFGAIPYP